MKDKRALLSSLMEVFNAWEDLLSNLGEDELSAHRFPAGWSIKDMIAHLYAWQQISNARLEAALQNAEPDLPSWLEGEDPFVAEEHTDEFNPRIHELHRDRPWPDVHRAWKEGYEHFLDLAQSIPQRRMLDAGRYPWLKGYALSAVIEGSSRHHQEHLEDLLAKLAPMRPRNNTSLSKDIPLVD